MTSPDRSAASQGRREDPLDTAVARSRIIKAIAADLYGRSSSAPLSAEDEARFKRVFEAFAPELRRTGARVDQFADPGRLPERRYLMDAEPERYPQAGIVENCAWYARELWRLAENIDRRLDPGREARAEQNLRKLSADADRRGPRHSAAARIVRNEDVRDLLRSGELPRTKALLEAIEAQQRGKLQKSPRAAAAESRSMSGALPVPTRKSGADTLAAGAAVAMPVPGNMLEHTKAVKEDPSLGALSMALPSDRSSSAWSNPFAKAARDSQVHERGRSGSRDLTAPAQARPAPGVVKRRSASLG